MSQQTLQRYRAICEASPDVLVLVEPGGTVTYTNARVEDLLGYEPNELVGESIELLVPESDREDHESMRLEYFETPEIRPMGVDLDLSARRKDGTTIPVAVSLSPIEHGDQLEVLAAIRDVSDRRALRTKYRTILEAVPDALVVADATTGEIVEANEHVVDLFGYPAEELVGERQTALHPSEDEARYRELFERHVTAGHETFTQLPDGSDVYVETRDGDRVPVEISACVFDLGDRRLIAGVFRDVTRWKEHERRLGALHETTRRLLAADEREEIARLVADAATNILGYASTVVRLVDGRGRLRPAAVTDRARAVLGHRPAYPLDVDTPVTRAYETGECLCYDDVCEVEDDHDRGGARAAIYLPMGTHGVMSIVDTEVGVFDQSDIELASVLATNAETAIDRLADARRLELQNERLDEFAGVVSHDLRNPLTAARGWLDLARDGAGDEPLDNIADALDRMAAIIDDTLTLARQGRTVAEMEGIDATRLAEACWELVSTGDATLAIDDGLRFRGDPDRVRQVLENLFRNAIEHGDGGTTVTVGPLGDQGFYVEDDGPGIPEDEREAVFDPGHTTSADGTGFGLTIVRRIAEAHGWNVRATDGAGGGARFEFTNVDVSHD